MTDDSVKIHGILYRLLPTVIVCHVVVKTNGLVGAAGLDIKRRVLEFILHAGLYYVQALRTQQ